MNIIRGHCGKKLYGSSAAQEWSGSPQRQRDRNELIILFLVIKFIFMNTGRVKMQIHSSPLHSWPHWFERSFEWRASRVYASSHRPSLNIQLNGCGEIWRDTGGQHRSPHGTSTRAKVVCANLWCVNTMTRILSIPTRADGLSTAPLMSDTAQCHHDQTQ